MKLPWQRIFLTERSVKSLCPFLSSKFWVTLLQTWQPLLQLTSETDSWLYLNKSACAMLISTFHLTHHSSLTWMDCLMWCDVNGQSEWTAPLARLLHFLPQHAFLFLGAWLNPSFDFIPLRILLTVCGLDFIYSFSMCTFIIFTPDWDSWGQKLSCFLVLLFLPEHLESAPQDIGRLCHCWRLISGLSMLPSVTHLVPNHSVILYRRLYCGFKYARHIHQALRRSDRNFPKCC